MDSYKQYHSHLNKELLRILKLNFQFLGYPNDSAAYEVTKLIREYLEKEENKVS
jgi:hypothetical protein